MNAGSVNIIIYIVLWGTVLFHKYRKGHFFGAACFLLLLNFVYAMCTFLLYNNITMSFKYQYGVMTLGPFLYLFVSEILVLSPVLRYNEGKIERIVPPNVLIIKNICYLFVIASILHFPYVLTNIKDGLVTLMESDDGGSDLYAQVHQEVVSSRGLVDSITSIIINVLGDIAFLSFFYLLSIGYRNRFFVYGFIFAIVICFLNPISKGLRTGVIMNALTLSMAYITMRKFLSESIQKKVNKTGFSIFAFVAFFFMLITISRFGQREGGSATYMLSYIGQANIYFNEYAFDANGIRNGDRTFNTFKQLLGFENVPNGIMETRIRYRNMNLGDEHFSTFVGDFCLDFGPVLSMIIFIFFAMFINAIIKIRKESIQFHDLLVLYFVMCICAQGGFYLFNYSFKGNYTILAFIVVYFLLKYDLNNKIKK